MTEEEKEALGYLYQIEDLCRELKEMCDGPDSEEEIYKAICDALKRGWNEPPVLADDAPREE